MKQILLFLLFIFISISTFATHNRAGEITYKQIGPRTFEVTITTYTKADAPADRCELTINWGDNTTSILPRINGYPNGSCPHNGVNVDNNIKRNVYVGTHTYPANGTYTLFMHDPNRNEGVLNIINSVNEPFYIQSIIKIGTGLGNNSSPVLLNPPTDFGCVNTPYIHNVAAYDEDGDSLSYKMVNCRGADGRELETTYDPEFNLDIILVDNKGTIYWESPIFAGIYNVAVEISEHRKDPISGSWITIGRILRDIQVDVTACTNNPPEIESPENFCVIGGEELSFTVTSTDEDGDKITLTAVGGPFITKPSATFPELIKQATPVSGDFVWDTDCSLARREPYYVTFKANDFPHDQHGNPIPGLSKQKVVEIRVLAAGVKNVETEEDISTATFDLKWDKTDCENAIGYKIFRKEHSGDIDLPGCEGGVPDDSGYELVATIDNIETDNFNDTNNDNAFKTGVIYCYVITTILYDESESLPSEPSCVTLKKRLPVMTNVDIEKTSYSVGEINVIWSKPTEIDANIYPGPYSYKLLRSTGLNSNNFIEVQSFGTINDTVYLDTELDTYQDEDQYGYQYRVDIYNNTGGNTNLMGKGYPATSPYLKVISGDEKLQLIVDQNVPWRIDSIVYFQEIDESLNFKRIGKINDEKLLGSTDGSYFVVEGLENGKEYCFRADIYGSYSVDGYVKPLFNRSQIGCGTPNVNPLQCPPTLNEIKDCDLDIYTLFWTNPNATCGENIVGYRLYYSLVDDAGFELLAEIEGENNREYDVIAEDIAIGCFRVTGIDALGNETPPSNVVCYEPCVEFILPNVFSPNGDGINDLYHPHWEDSGDHDYNFDVISFDIEIFNRWGNLVYKTDDININWDGKNQSTGKVCSTGVYYYVCTIAKKENNDESSTFSLTGYIHLMR
ncbi:MAG: gliding motility-associated C-terminal domain-containing protein [Flavobacteriales bacterium]|nr:gliding motility-associated C-terminal domain-containing protein [Flavobacteriales bacterium]